MAFFPKIQSPCPYKGDLAAIMDGETCTRCERQVIDISAHSDAERVALIAGCADEVCVTYKFPVRAAVAAVLAAAAFAAPMAAAAQEAEVERELIIVGGINDPANVEFVSDGRDDAVPEIAVVYDDDARANQTEEAADTSAAATNLGQAVETQ